MGAPAKVAQRVDELRAAINRHNRLYYVQAAPEISDFEYDQLFAELERLEQQHPELVTHFSPTQRVGGEPLDELVQVAHVVPMLSLDNTYSKGELHAWHARTVRHLGEAPAGLTAELKIDGVSISLIYENGRLVRAVTRGNSVVGDDVTANARAIRQLPLELDNDLPLLEVRGEVYMPRSVFAEHNRRRLEAGEPLLANPRNATAGSIRLLDPRESARRRLSLWCYQVARVEGRSVDSHSQALELLGELGLPVSPGWRRCSDLAEVEALIDEWQSSRTELDFDTDGAVIKVDRFAEQRLMGATARAVRWAVAFKYPPEGKTTVVKEIVVQVGRTGVLTPVASLEPVQVAGSTVSRATLHNFDEVARLDVRRGDTVWITKGGEVIPKVVGVVSTLRPEQSEPFVAPDACPECGSQVERVGDEVALRCTNPACPAITAARLRHFVSRGAMDIDGLGGRLLDQLVQEGLVSDAASLWDLQSDRLADLPGWGEVSAANLVRNLEQASGQPLQRLIFALGIPHVGEGAARLLAQRFGTLAGLAAASRDDIETIEGIGPVMADSVRRWLDDPVNQELLARLRERGVDPEERVTGEQLGGPLADQVMVITGTLSRPRPQLKQRLEQLGATVTGSVSKKTTLVLAGDDSGSKVDKAQRLGVTIINEEQLDELIRDSGGEGLWEK